MRCTVVYMQSGGSTRVKVGRLWPSGSELIELHSYHLYDQKWVRHPTWMVTATVGRESLVR
jgi:hypothetical protein